MRRPVRTITRPPISSRRIRFGEPTSSALSGVTVARLQAEPVPPAWPPPPRGRPGCRSRAGTRARGRSGRVDLESDHVGREHAQRLLQQLLPGLVAFEDHDRGLAMSPWITLWPRVHDSMARRGGWRRKGRRRFRYFDSRGKQITDAAKLARIDELVIPPAWKDVWISSRGARSCRQRASTGRPAAVPLSPGIPGATGAGEIRQARALRGAPSRFARGDGEGPRPEPLTLNGRPPSRCG